VCVSSHHHACVVRCVPYLTDPAQAEGAVYRTLDAVARGGSVSPRTSRVRRSVMAPAVGSNRTQVWWRHSRLTHLTHIDVHVLYAITQSTSVNAGAAQAQTPEQKAANAQALIDADNVLVDCKCAVCACVRYVMIDPARPPPPPPDTKLPAALDARLDMSARGSVVRPTTVSVGDMWQVRCVLCYVRVCRVGCACSLAVAMAISTEEVPAEAAVAARRVQPRCRRVRCSGVWGVVCVECAR
jgi:hypothetical protein